METKFNFNSAICTSLEQSRRLIALGLKKETADMCWTQEGDGWGGVRWYCRAETYIESEAEKTFLDYIPAWSLHRMIEMMRVKASIQVVPLDNTYDTLIDGIEQRIKEGYFNKEYLCEK